uniref:Uncharacterized protein n=1 Tax=Arundo donax TaxID=35708 RepID=A0A0A9FHW6_ARUDO
MPVNDQLFVRSSLTLDADLEDVDVLTLLELEDADLEEAKSHLSLKGAVLLARTHGCLDVLQREGSPVLVSCCRECMSI